jgi:hypothetical protein
VVLVSVGPETNMRTNPTTWTWVLPLPGGWIRGTVQSRAPLPAYSEKQMPVVVSESLANRWSSPARSGPA